MFKFILKVVGAAGYIIQYACITHCAFEYIGDFVICSGPSMEPTLFSNNILMTDRISPRLYRFQRGDIIIAKSPTNPTQQICKRIVGMPGDRIVAALEASDEFILNVSTKDKKITSNKTDTTIAAENPIQPDENNNDSINKSSVKLSEIIVPRGHVWIEGDNSQNSSDSRYYGPIPQGLIKGRVLCRVWPLHKMQLLT